MLSTNQKKTTFTFGIIAAIFLTIVALVGVVAVTAVPVFSGIVSNAVGNQQPACDCVHHVGTIGSLVNFPYNGIPLIVFGSAAMIFLLFVIAAITLNLLRTSRFTKRLLRSRKKMSSKLLDVSTSVNLQNRVLELASNKHEIFCTGIIRPTICVSSQIVNKVSKNQLRAILLHEKNHLQSHDPLKLFVVNIVNSCLFYIPGMRRLVDQFKTGLELAADDLATNNHKDIRSLGKALLTLTDVSERNELNTPDYIAPTFINATETRIDGLINHERQNIFRWFVPKLYISIIIIVSAFTMLFTSHTLHAKTQIESASAGMSGASCTMMAPVNTCDSSNNSCHSCDVKVSSCDNTYFGENLSNQYDSP